MKIKGFIALFAAAAMLSTLGGCAEKKNDSKTQPESSASSQPESALINAEHIYQLDKWPTGCESVSAVMAMKAAGLDITVDEFIDNYLNCTPRPFDPEKSFGGDPRSKSGKGCYAPVIKAALDKALASAEFHAKQVKGLSAEELCKKYVSAGTPVIFWGTIEMAEPFKGDSWEFKGKKITWIRPEHCLLLIGYDSDNYIFCDPMRQEDKTAYPKSSVERAYEALHSQAVVIERE
mgnify:FL=1